MHLEPIVTEIERLYVRGYKNLDDVELPWSRTMVLFGANGAGKTNLLECLAMLFGTKRTLELVSERATPILPGQVACIVRSGSWLLPLAPATAHLISRITANDRGDASDRKPWLQLATDARASLAWWSRLEVPSDATSVEAAFLGAGLPPEVAAFLSAESARPRVRYELQELAMPSAIRTFSRTWVVTEVPDAVITHAAVLPDVFEPLRAWAAGPRTLPAEVAVLPDTGVAPVRVEWLARPRRADEIDADVVEVMNTAEPHVHELAALVGDYLSGEAGAEGRWWLHEHGAARANEELRHTMPHLSVGGIGDIEESWRITSSGRDVGATDEAGYADALSSGERRWVDEALATLARSVADLGRRCAWQSWVWDKAQADDEAILGEVLQVLPAVEDEEMVSAAVLARVVELFDTTLTAAAREWTADANAPLELWHEFVPALSDVTRPPLTIRVLDEPEAHLHPAAQRHLATGLAEMAAGNDLVLASHSPYLLGQRDWTYCSVSNGRANVLPSTTLDAAGSLAREVGLTRGELLVTTRAVLLVEGRHDQEFLRILFGDDLREAGIAVVPTHGTKGAPNLVDSEFWRAFTGTPFHVMFDNTRLPIVRDRTVAKTLLTTEEQTMRELLTSVVSGGRTLGAIGLARPDIAAYIAEQVLPGDFPGWTAVLDRWKREERPWRRNTRTGFKPWLTNRYKIDQLTTTTVARYAESMKAAHLSPPGDLTRKINRLIARPDGIDS